MVLEEQSGEDVEELVYSQPSATDNTATRKN